MSTRVKTTALSSARSSSADSVLSGDCDPHCLDHHDAAVHVENPSLYHITWAEKMFRCQPTASTENGHPVAELPRSPEVFDGALSFICGSRGVLSVSSRTEEVEVPNKKANVKNKDQYEALKEKGMSKERAARIANSPDSSKKGGESSKKGSSRSSSKQGGTTAQKKAAGRKGGKATARKRSS